MSLPILLVLLLLKRYLLLLTAIVKKKFRTIDYGLYLGHHLSMYHPPLVHHQRLDVAVAAVKQKSDHRAASCQYLTQQWRSRIHQFDDSRSAAKNHTAEIHVNVVYSHINGSDTTLQWRIFPGAPSQTALAVKKKRVHCHQEIQRMSLSSARNSLITQCRQ